MSDDADPDALDADLPTEPLVKSLTFETLRTFLPSYFSGEEVAAIRARLGPEALAALDDAVPGSWVLEARMFEVMDAVYTRTLGGDDEAFVAFARALAHEGIGRFMRVILSLASAGFVLRRIPAVWNRLRKNAGEVEATQEGDVVRLSYRDFPFFRHRVYRLLSLANCQALVEAATKRRPAGVIASHSDSTLVLEFDLSQLEDVAAA